MTTTWHKGGSRPDISRKLEMLRHPIPAGPGAWPGGTRSFSWWPAPAGETQKVPEVCWMKRGWQWDWPLSGWDPGGLWEAEGEALHKHAPKTPTGTRRHLTDARRTHVPTVHRPDGQTGSSALLVRADGERGRNPETAPIRGEPRLEKGVPVPQTLNALRHPDFAGVCKYP